MRNSGRVKRHFERLEGDDFCTHYLVQFIIKLRQLGHVLHDILAHEERCAHAPVALLLKHPQSQLYEGLNNTNKKAQSKS